MLVFLRLLIFFISTVLLVRLAQLQLIEGSSYIQRSAQNRFRITTIPAQRGLIMDRNGEILAQTINEQRVYPKGADFAHILGYVAQADSEDIGFFGVELGREVGKMGLEKEENQVLSGIDGGMVEEISATGEKLRIFSQKEAVAGQNIQLNLDYKLQQNTREILIKSGFRGAVIAGDTFGNILAMVSVPDFDPNIFSRQDTLEIQKVLNDEHKAMFNRAIGGLYPPASTFKIVTAIAGLESKAFDKNTLIEDTGVLRVGDFSYSNWFYTGYGGTDGQVNVIKALQRSNDIFFYKAGEVTGIDEIARWAKKMGLGSKTGLMLEGESTGLIPDQEWKKENRNEDWYLGDTYITAIGQGNLLVTPLQIAMLTTSVANDGKRCPPELIAATLDKPLSLEQVKERGRNRRCFDLGIAKQVLSTVKEGMQKACESGGTGWPLFDFQYTNPDIVTDERNFIKIASGSGYLVRTPVACKTGTAEIGGFDSHGELNEKTHAWFTAFAPVAKPEIVVTVLLEEAGQGSDKAGPVAREVLKTYFEEVR